MYKNKFGSVRWLVICIIFYLLYEKGLIGLIDGLQLLEVLITSFVLSVMKRIISRRKQGLCNIMEITSIISGVVWTILNLLFMLLHYTYLEKKMIDVSLLSFVYGVIVSLFNSFLIKKYSESKNKDVRVS